MTSLCSLSRTLFIFSLLGFVISDVRVGYDHMGSYGYKCITPCDYHDDYDYLWCEAEHPTDPLPGLTYWDYCSQQENYDYKGNRCWHNHGCGNHGYKYKWCYLDEEYSWGYCGYDVKTSGN